MISGNSIESSVPISERQFNDLDRLRVGDIEENETFELMENSENQMFLFQVDVG